MMNSSDDMKSRMYRFGRVDGSFIANIALQPDGSISGSDSANERFWAVQHGSLVFQNDSHEVTTIFDKMDLAGFPQRLGGYFVPYGRVTWHVLTELTFEEAVTDAVNRRIFGQSLDAFTISKCVELAAAFDTAAYFTQKMSGASSFTNKLDLLADAMKQRSVEGLIMEFGVYSGSTVNHIAKLTDQTVYGFDVFSGLPEDWRRGFAKNTFSLSELPEVETNVRLVAGLFEETLTPFMKSNAGPVSFIHVDCDLYSSTRTVFQKLRNSVVSGTVIVFDEYFNYPGWRDHEFKAFQEFIAATGKTYKYISYVDTHQQVAIEITG